MENQSVNIRERQFPLELIADEVLGVKLSKEQKDMMSYGEEVFLSKMQLNNGTVRDGKVKLTKDKSGEMALAFNFKKEELKIDDEYLNKKLTPKEKEDLEKGKTVGPLIVDGKDHFIAIDNTLNSVTVKSAFEVGIKRTIGEYTFSDNEMNILANGEKLEPKVFKGENGYFLANLQRTEDKRGITFSNIMALDNEQAKEMIAKYNKGEEKTQVRTSDVAMVAAGALDVKPNEKTHGVDQEINIKHYSEEEILEKGSVKASGIKIESSVGNGIIIENETSAKINVNEKTIDPVLKDERFNRVEKYVIDNNIVNQTMYIAQDENKDLHISRDNGKTYNPILPEEAAAIESKATLEDYYIKSNNLKIDNEIKISDPLSNSNTAEKNGIIKEETFISPLSIEEINKQKELTTAIHEKQFTKINELVSKGVTPTPDDLLTVKLSNAFSPEDKIALLTTLGQKPDLSVSKETIKDISADKIVTSEKTKTKGMSM